MNGITVVTVKTPAQKRRFCAFPRRLYGRKCPTDPQTERALLDGVHPLSDGFALTALLAVDGDGTVRGRCALTDYPDDPVGYVGFFESENDETTAKRLLETAASLAVSRGKTSLLGPVDASIYIGYRFKTDHFERLFTGEPYNKPYYPALWEMGGFTVRDRYASHHMRPVAPDELDGRLCRIRERYEKRGYRFEEPTPRTFERCLADVHGLMMQTYTAFSGFKPLSREAFLTMFSSLKRAVNMSMIKLVYKEDRLCAFAVAVPDYGWLTRGRMTPLKAAKMLWIKRHPKQYVVLYVGAAPTSYGLGGAVVHELRNEFAEVGCRAVGALIKDGTVTGAMYAFLQDSHDRYVLMERKIVEK